MVYGRFQYYTDELNCWNRIITFHKDELRELLRQMSVMLGQQIVSPADMEESNSFTDQLTVQEQQFDNISNRIISQRQRLEHTAFYPGKPIEPPVSQQQDALRSKMQSAERSFIRTKYTCSIFLSSFLNGRSLSLQN